MDRFRRLGIYEVIKYYNLKVWYVRKKYPITYCVATFFEILTSCVPGKYKKTQQRTSVMFEYFRPLLL